MTQKAKGPATAATVPDHGSNPERGIMNMGSNTTELPDAASEHPWVKARRLARELSDTMASIDVEERPDHAIIFPDARHGYRIGFATREGDQIIPAAETPLDRADYHAFQLAHVLNEYGSGEWMAVIVPESKGKGYPVMFGPIKCHRSNVETMADRAACEVQP